MPKVLDWVYENERTVFIITALLLIFLWVHFNPTLSSLYLGFLVVSIILFILDKNPELNLERRKDNRSIAFLEAAIYYVVFFIIYAVILSAFQTKFSIQTILQSLSATTPIFANSVFLSVIAWGILVPVIETLTFVRVYEWLVEKTHSSLNNWFSLIIPIFLISAAFMFFHLQAKGIKDIAALIATFVFMLITLVIVTIKKETKQAVLFHIFVNIIAVLTTFGLIFK